MSTQITTAFVQEFKSGIDHLVQQDDSRLRNAVTIESVGPGKQAFFDQLGATAMTERTTRHADTAYTDTPHGRRMVPLRDYDVADLIDDPDKIRVLNDPTNAYSQAMAMAAMRNIDDVIIAAALGTAATGETGSGSATATAAIVNDVDITTAIMAQVKRTMDEDEVPDSDRHIIMPASQFEELLTDAQFQSSDFNSIKALVRGEVNTWLGFEFHRSERLETDGSSKKCFAWHKSGIKLAIGKDTTGRIDVLPTKRYSTQVFYSHTIGSVRMEEEKVVRLDLLTA
ncbi:MAG: phage capsid protein [Nannocystaceae bacterium]